MPSYHQDVESQKCQGGAKIDWKVDSVISVHAKNGREDETHYWFA